MEEDPRCPTMRFLTFLRVLGAAFMLCSVLSALLANTGSDLGVDPSELCSTAREFCLCVVGTDGRAGKCGCCEDLYCRDGGCSRTP